MTATGALPRHLFLDANVLFSPVAFDVFLSLAELAALDAATLRETMAELEAAKRNPPRTHEEERALLARSGLVKFAEALARLS